MTRYHMLIMLASLTIVGGTLPSQTLLYTYPGTTLSFGDRVVGVGDVDGDGLPDFSISDPFTALTPGMGFGYSNIHSGASGDLIATIEPPPGESGQVLDGVGDLNGDGLDDVLRFGAVGTSRIVSVLSGEVLLTLPFVFGRGIGDVNGDGLPDLVFTDTLLMINAVSGATGQVIWTMPMSSIRGIDVIGDVNGDGVSDLIVGTGTSMPEFFLSEVSRGRADVLSGADGSTLHTHLGASAGSYFGQRVSGVDDVDGDHVPDYAVFASGGQGFQNGSFVLNSLGGNGQTYLYSGATGQPLLTIDCPNGQCHISSGGPQIDIRGGIGDLDGDGRGDLLRMDWGDATRVHSGRTGEVIASFPPPMMPNAVNLFGLRSDAVGDLNGDGVPEFIFQSGPSLGSVASHVYVYSFTPAGVTHFGMNCEGTNVSQPRIGTRGKAAPGETLIVSTSSVPANQTTVLLTGFSNTLAGNIPLPFSLSGFGAPGCDLLVSLDACFFTISEAFGQNASASVALSIPNLPFVSDITFYAQWLTFSSGSSFALSRAIAVDVQ